MNDLELIRWLTADPLVTQDEGERLYPVIVPVEEERPAPRPAPRPVTQPRRELRRERSS